MAGFVPTLYWFDRFDERLGTLPVRSELVHTEEVSGEDVLEFDSPRTPSKGDRLVWLDPDDGSWREHVVVRTEEDGGGLCAVHAEGSLCELLCDFVQEVHLSAYSAADALAAALSPTRWDVGEVDDLGEAGCVLYHLSALAALRKVEDVWGGEAVARIGVADGRVSSRSVDLVAEQGQWRGLRLVYGKNMAGCTRTVLDDDVYTALYGWGAGLPCIDEETGEYTGGYTRKLSFADVNDGVAWVGDEDARELWGRWDAERGELVHSFGQVTFSDCEDEEELLELTREALSEACAPKVSYEVDAALLSGQSAGLGDTVAVVDSTRSPEWRVSARVVRRQRSFGERVARTLTIGAAEPADWARASDVEAAVEVLQQDVVAAAATAGYAAEAAGYEDLSEVEF